MDLVRLDRERPRFPPELFANIIDHQDQEALTTSSLVCSTWLYFSRPRLFSSLRFDERRIRMFIYDPNIINSPLSTIRPVVTHIIIYNSLPLEHPEILHLFKSSFKSVTRLSYCPYCIFPILNPQKIRILADTFRTITSLTIIGDFRNFHQLVTFICAFPFLTTLDVKAEIGFELPSPPSSSYPGCKPSPTLRILTLECNLEAIIPWFLQLPSIPQISELTLKGFIGWSASHIARLLRALGPSLVHLNLVEKNNIYFASFHDIRSMAFSLQSTSLQSFQFSCFRPTPSYTLTALVIKMFLAHLTTSPSSPSSLRQISISLNPSTMFDPVVWEGIDETVAGYGARCTGFERFVMRIYRGGVRVLPGMKGKREVHDIVSGIEKSFPICCRLGILQIGFLG